MRDRCHEAEKQWISDADKAHRKTCEEAVVNGMK